jgi:HEXXH motif-containing protein
VNGSPLSSHFAPPEVRPFPLSAPWHLAWLAERGPAHNRSIIESRRDPPARALKSLCARGLAPRRRNAPDDLALADAEALIALVPDLYVIVRRLVHGLGVISSQGPDYDTSHSEPAWPGWIFVSIPDRGPRGALRLAEGVIHEAMHHNLSALEHQVGLALPDHSIYSPWKHEFRTASGVLHGLYVFICLAAYFHQISAGQSFAADAASARVAGILEEVDTIDRARLEAALSEPGVRICQALYDAAKLFRSVHG